MATPTDAPLGVVSYKHHVVRGNPVVQLPNLVEFKESLGEVAYSVDFGLGEDLGQGCSRLP